MLGPFDLILRIESSPIASQGYLYAIDAALTAQYCELKVAAVLGTKCLKILCALPSDHKALKRLRQLELMEILVLGALEDVCAPDNPAGAKQGEKSLEDSSGANLCKSNEPNPPSFVPGLKLKVRLLKEEELIALTRNVKELSF